jgi:TonB family protein
MKRPTLTRSGFIYVVVLLFLIQFGFGSPRRIPSPARFQNDVAWIPFVPAGEDVSAMIPAPPNLLIQPNDYLLERNGEKILAHRTYGGYSGGLVYTIDSYKANRPERLLNRLLEIGGFQAMSARDLVVDGIKAKEYRRDPTRFYSRVICLLTKQHVYFLTVATREENHPFIDRFLSSFRLRRPQDKETADSFAPENSDIKPDEVFEIKDVTNKALIAWREIPGYTEQARQHQLRGTVSLEGVFAANGYVTNVKVTKEMKDGMTEKAIEYTRSIRFFPAEKDGKPVAQRMVLEYNFNLY